MALWLCFPLALLATRGRSAVPSSQMRKPRSGRCSHLAQGQRAGVWQSQDLDQRILNLEAPGCPTQRTGPCAPSPPPSSPPSASQSQPSVSLHVPALVAESHLCLCPRDTNTELGAPVGDYTTRITGPVPPMPWSWVSTQGTA